MQLYQLGNGLGERVQETGAVLKVMHQVASQTNLLGLNASIEAARVGEKGLGFGVVADEIRKLSENSVRSLKDIGDILKTLNTANNGLFHEIEQVTRISGEQAKAVQNVTAAIHEVNVLAQSLLQFTEQLIIK
jgi:methyl-accepting chemotaxis protein